MPAAIWWIRRDLRLADNAALHSALQAEAVIPLFILDPALLERSRWHTVADMRRAFLFGGLRSLDAALRERGSRLIVRAGNPLDVLRQVMAETNAAAIYAEEDYSPYAVKRDAAIAKALPLTLLTGLTVHPPLAVLKPDGKPYTVFTPFSKTWKSLPLPTQADLLPAPSHLNTPPLPSVDLPHSSPPTHFPPGEAEAHRRLEQFVSDPIFNYGPQRDRLDLDGTSTLSPYFRFGMLSARQAVVVAVKAAQGKISAQRGVEVWINELIWREFYISILYHFPHVLDTAFNPALRAIEWRDAPDDLSAWQQGRTGYPVVDAALRQLHTTGWVHNRARMIVASFLVKDLLINWQAGERWFMQHLVDGDPAANNGGWQWTAGVGTDAAPYFRIFNPVLQSQKFDPNGDYIRRYVPELATVPTQYIHEPWRMPEALQRQIGVVIGRDYPKPIVERSLVKARTLAAYKGSQGK